jgi:hypothetical protein
VKRRKLQVTQLCKIPDTCLTVTKTCITLVLQGGLLTIRLDDDTEREIEIATKTLGVSKSELIRRSVKDYLAKIRKPSFGEVASS